MVEDLLLRRNVTKASLRLAQPDEASAEPLIHRRLGVVTAVRLRVRKKRSPLVRSGPLRRRYYAPLANPITMKAKYSIGCFITFTLLISSFLYLVFEPGARVFRLVPGKECPFKNDAVFIIATYASAADPEELLVKNLRNIATFYGPSADVFLSNNHGSSNARKTLLAAVTASGARRVRVVDNVESATFGYEFGAIRAVSRDQGWTQSRCIPYKYVFVMQETMALIAPISTRDAEAWDSVGRSFLRFYYFEWDLWPGNYEYMTEFMERNSRALRIPTYNSSRYAFAPRSAACGVFGPGWGMSQTCARALLDAGIFEHVAVSTKADEMSTERWLGVLAAQFCNTPCGHQFALDGDYNAYPCMGSSLIASEEEVLPRHIMKRWGSHGSATAVKGCHAAVASTKGTV